MTESQPANVERVGPTLDQGTEDHQIHPADDEAPLDVTDLVEGKYWKLDHLQPYEEVERQIIDVDLVQFKDKDGNVKLDKDGVPEKPKPSLTLDDDKVLSCGILNTRALVRAFGNKDNIRAWRGQRILIWHDPDTRYGNAPGMLKVKPCSEVKRTS